MPRLNPLPAKKMVKILLKLGFQEIRAKGSHHFFFNPISKKQRQCQFMAMNI